MKIISGNLNGENIQLCCPCCHCTYELESKDDFTIHWIFKRSGDFCDYSTEIPEYKVKCPVCGYEVYVGIDNNDCDNWRGVRGVFGDIIMNRSDWKSRYKVEPRKRRGYIN